MKTPTAALAKPNPVSSGIVRVVGEAELSLERQRVALVQVLLLPAVVAVEARLHRVAAQQLRDADRHVLRGIGIQKRGIRQVWRRACRYGLPHGNVGASSARPLTKNGGATSSITDRLYEPSGSMFAFGIQLRKRAQSAIEPVRAVAVDNLPEAAIGEAVGPLDERRRVEGVIRPSSRIACTHG